jgi:signal transduction histidine kinase
MSLPEIRLEELTLGRVALEELVDRDALSELVTSFYELFRVPLRVFSEEGLLIESGREAEIYAYLSGSAGGKQLVYDMIEAVKNARPEPGQDQDYECFTGAAYRISAIVHDHRVIGRIVMGPYLPPTVKQVPKALVQIEGVDPKQIKDLLAKLPRAKAATVAQIARHMRRNLDLILNSGHKSLLTSSMHLASVRESYRDLESKNRKLQQAYDQLKELDRLKSNFLATVSHELRTPLTSIIGFSEMLAGGIGGSLTSEQAEFVDTIHEKGKQLLQLITDLLDLSRLENETMSLRRSEVQLVKLAEEVVRSMQPQAKKKQVILEIESNGHVPAVSGDPDRLRQVLINLIDNAIKFTPQGGTVHTTLEKVSSDLEDDDGIGAALLAGSRSDVQVTVSDTGCGIPQEEKNRVFDAFYQVETGNTRHAGGTGLGLSIVKRLVEGHGGSIHVEDNEPEGANMVFTIPIH